MTSVLNVCSVWVWVWILGCSVLCVCIYFKDLGSSIGKLLFEKKEKERQGILSWLVVAKFYTLDL